MVDSHSVSLGLTRSRSAGGALQTFAFALAPVSLLQPVSGIGLAGLALYSHFALHDKLRREEWVAVAVACLGTLGLGVSSAADSASLHAVPFWRMFVVLAATGWVVLQKMTETRERMGGKSKKMSAAMFGLQAGGMFGLSASTVRTGFIMRSHRWTWAPFGLMLGVMMSSYGFVLQTSGLKEGSAVIVCTCLAVSSMFVGVVTGIAGLGEPVPATFLSMLVRLVSWACIIVGVVVLSGASKQVEELVAYLLEYVPAKVWLMLPEEVAIKVKNWRAFVRADGAGSGPLSPRLGERIGR